MGKEVTHHPEQPFEGIIRPLQEQDILNLQPILETWIKNGETNQVLEDEVRSVMDAMKESLTGQSNRTYLVAQTTTGELIGTMGCKIPGQDMLPFALTSNPIEIINAYVAQQHRAGKGVGRALAKAIETKAQVQGYKELLVNSGPRYKDTGWGFWTKLYGEPATIAEKMYGQDGDAPVWRKVF